MPKDYAGHRTGGKRQVHTGGSRMPGWLWALLGLSLGLCVAALVYIVYRPLDSGAPAGGTARPATADSPSPDIPPRQEARFKFYDLLPRSEVQPSEEPYRPAPTPEGAAASHALYLIQAGSFKRREDAERRKATIALLGIESGIREVEIEGQGLRYRVQIGPAMNRHDAEKTMRQLAENDIDSFATRSGG